MLIFVIHFTEYFQFIYKPNTPDVDSRYEIQVQDILAEKADDVRRPALDINDIQRCVDKTKCRKSPGHDGIMAVKQGGPELNVHLCLLFNPMIKYTFV